ncbi:hypothetical protein C8F04DRAFT_285669 [Mycena alexandri]|uniref:MYND-type domain-containing protein n=1 Tax=Mycena alexandri TaxID=1745969 RepID=A0AAD6WPT5_9AGAR|nr:hypothetical protein C8F04DRAFT_285669 [Mycena alexandri]
MMARRLTLEGTKGIGGGGMIIRTSEESLYRAEEALEQNKPTTALRFAQEAVRQDPNNLDAIMIVIRYLKLPEAIRTLEAAEASGRAFLEAKSGNDVFQTPVRNFFWGTLMTRPYVRLVKMLIGLAYDDKQFELAARMSVQALRICPEDSFGQHVPLTSLLVRLERYADALSLCQKWITASESSSPLDVIIPMSPRPELGGTAFDPPHRELLSVVDMDSMIANRQKEEGVQGAVVHNAALSTFKLWGDCPQSRQYLELAARINPLILFKILGQITVPKRPSAQMRIPNGAEDAQSYLWRSQELWMKPDVWDWANANENVRVCVRRICSGCEHAESAVAAFKRCAGCHLVSYCGSTCQKANWRTHKEACKKHQEKKDSIRAFGAKVPRKKKTTTASE